MCIKIFKWKAEKSKQELQKGLISIKSERNRLEI